MLFDQFKGTNMNFRKTLLALSVLSAAGLPGCGGSSHDHPVLTSASGTAIDGYLQGAIVCFDTDGDKSCDGEASSTTTDINGAFSLSGTGAAGAVILVESVADTTESNTPGVTGALAGVFTLTAIQGATIVSPFTTMIQVGVEHGVYATVAVAEATIVTALGLTDGTDIQSYDFIEEGNASVIATAEAVTGVIITNTAEVEDISDDAGASFGDETIFETAILELIDIDGTDTESDFEALADVIDDDPTDTTAIDAAIAVASVDSTDAGDASDVGDSLDDVNDTNSEEAGGGDSGTGGTGGTGAI